MSKEIKHICKNCKFWIKYKRLENTNKKKYGLCNCIACKSTLTISEDTCPEWDSKLNKS